MTGDFSADDYRDDYRQALMAVIERKVAGEVPEPAERPAPSAIGDLRAALEASVAAARSAREERATREGEAHEAAETSARQRRRKSA
jgi:DNA end-binding protein Ku